MLRNSQLECLSVDISKVFLGVIFKLSQRENIQAPPGPPAHGGDSKKMPEAFVQLKLAQLV